ncbi:DUF418 domain-containing protein [Streptosporangium sp. NPDC002524]|uniref:DUF418 domain-containing protein n=1 Tax=Streptosporangium sp. NPDC002524 TaxID=3154537 RepID=UPI0033238A6A
MVARPKRCAAGFGDGVAMPDPDVPTRPARQAPAQPATQAPPQPARHAPVAPKQRIAALDALRGFALCGIIFINIPQTMEMFAFAGQLPTPLRLFFYGRFYPIFYLLFGVGFGIFLRSAMRRSERPRLLLVRRFVALAVLGGILHLLQPGEVLLPFAITGLLVLLPLSYLPGRALFVAGVLLTVAGVLAGVGGLGLLPGLFALGFALAELRVPERLEESRGRLVGFGVAAAVTALLTYGLIMLGPPDIAQIRLGMILSLATAACYTAGFLLLLRTRIGVALSWVLAPMGRMALTNYFGAALLFVPIGTAIGLRDSSSWDLAVLLGVCILVFQAAVSIVWLRMFGYGPLEWAWRCVTYWQWLPIGGASTRAHARTHTRADTGTSTGSGTGAGIRPAPGTGAGTGPGASAGTGPAPGSGAGPRIGTGTGTGIGIGAGEGGSERADEGDGDGGRGRGRAGA